MLDDNDDDNNNFDDIDNDNGNNNDNDIDYMIFCAEECSDCMLVEIGEKADDNDYVECSRMLWLHAGGDRGEG